MQIQHKNDVMIMSSSLVCENYSDMKHFKGTFEKVDVNEYKCMDCQKVMSIKELTLVHDDNGRLKMQVSVEPKKEKELLDKEYEQIQFSAGHTIENAVEELLAYKEKGVLAYGYFNGKKLCSDTVTMDQAYQEISGMTKDEFDQSLQKRKERYEQGLKEHAEKVPELIEHWKKKGREILTEDKWERWDVIVPVRAADLYRGAELGACLDLVEILNNKCTLNEAKRKIESQSHSGMSFSLVCAMVKEFCERGDEFVEHVR